MPIKDIFQLFRDLFIGFMPVRISKKYKFAFLVHPRDITDVYRKFPFAKKLPKSLVVFYCRYAWPVIVSKITGLKSQKTNEEILGLVISIPMTAKQMMENRDQAVKRIIQAIKMAEKWGAELVGLGALTASVTKGGLDLIDKVKTGITNGHAYTSYIVTRNVFKALRIIELPVEQAVVAVVGAAGSIGSTSAEILAKNNVRKLILVDLENKDERLNELKEELMSKYSLMDLKITHHIHDIYSADAVIAATNAPEAVIKPEDLKPGAIVVDDAQPSDLSNEILKERNDVLAIEGGVVHTPGVSINFNMGLTHREDNFSCLAEVLILASVNWKGSYNLGWAKLERVKEIVKLAKPLNFRLAVFQNRQGEYNKERIKLVKEARESYVF